MLRSIILFLLPVLAAACGPQDGTPSDLAGDFRTTYVATPMPLGPDVTTAQIEELLHLHFPHRRDPQLPNAALATRLVAVARCFGLDGALFASLVRQESAFARTATSPTGAAGLTQFTTVGIRETDDQLGERGPSEARPAATRTFLAQAQDCVVPALGRPAWKPLWRRLGPDLKRRRDHLKDDADDALIYGAILLKTDLSVARTLAPADDPSAWYGAALERYNGDPDPAVREDYRDRIEAFAEELRAL